MYVETLKDARTESKLHPNKNVYVDWNNPDDRRILKNGIIIHGKAK